MNLCETDANERPVPECVASASSASLCGKSVCMSATSEEAAHEVRSGKKVSRFFSRKSSAAYSTGCTTEGGGEVVVVEVVEVEVVAAVAARHLDEVLHDEHLRAVEPRLAALVERGGRRDAAAVELVDVLGEGGVGGALAEAALLV